jgi:two-component system, OmpR family, phosphate regulon sensor histidine kinase PhoR
VTPLTRAVNDFVSFAESSLNDASLRVKEMQIQLKVATAQRQHAEAILFSISDAVLVTDAFDQVLLANDAAAKAFGFDLVQATRQPVDKVVTDPRMVQLIRDMRASGSINSRRIVEHQYKTGQSSRTFKVTLSGVSDRADEPAGVVAVLHDMTKEKEVAEMKNDFVSNVSHELRTPLASIKAYVEMLIDGEADDEKTKREFYDVIQNEANRLGRLIDNILNISRIESGLVKVNKQPQSVTVILKEAIEVITPQAKMKQIAIVEQLTPVFYQTQADKDMLYQAVLNLLSNAVKYTRECGQITVQTLVDEQKKRVITRISDTGVGIPPKDLPLVFDKFYRSEANNKMAKGTGLGLSLVKHIIETVHHGRIFVESEVGKGSTFGFELDLSE